MYSGTASATYRTRECILDWINAKIAENLKLNYKVLYNVDDIIPVNLTCLLE
jgi:hypothetical protein